MKISTPRLLPLTVYGVFLILLGLTLLPSLIAMPVYGESTNSWNLMKEGTNLKFYYYTTTAQPNALYLTSTGNAGVGTSSPTSNINPGARILDISDSGVPALTLHDTSPTQEFAIANDGGSGVYFDIGGAVAATNNDFHFRTSTTNSSYSVTEKMTLQSDGNVGIGVVSPGSKLEVDSGGNTAAMVIDNGSYYGARDTGGTIRAALWGRFTDNATYLDGGTGGLYLRTNDSTVTNMYLKNDGNVGIGTTTPFAKFQVTTATDNNLIVANQVNLTSGISLISRNNAYNVYRGMEFLGSSFAFNAGKVGINTVAAAPASELHIKQAANGQFSNGITLERAGATNRFSIVVGADNRLYIFPNQADQTKYMTLDGAGNITTTGNITAAGTVTANGVLLTSSKTKKENFQSLDYQEILRKIDKLPVMGWNYKDQDPSIKHIGPFAEDFHTMFGLNNDDKTINMIDEGGVALAGIKALSEQVKQQQEEIELLKKEIQELKK